MQNYTTKLCLMLLWSYQTSYQDSNTQFWTTTMHLVTESIMPQIRYVIIIETNGFIASTHALINIFRGWLFFEGFKVGKTACIGNWGGRDGKEALKVCSHPDEYVLFDGGHTTMRTNRQLAELLWNGKPNITGPYNINQLFDLP